MVRKGNWNAPAQTGAEGTVRAHSSGLGGVGFRGTSRRPHPLHPLVLSLTGSGGSGTPLGDTASGPGVQRAGEKSEQEMR